MKVLIVGGTGLISTGITRALVERGDDVTLYNRGKREAEVAAPVKRIIGDRSDFPRFEAQMAEAGTFDVVIDMVAFLPEEVESAIRAFRGRSAHYVFCSTVDVYTKPAAVYPVRDDAERAPSPAFPYALNKARCERILEEAHARGDFAVTLIRPAWTYGEGGSILHSLGWGSYFIDRIRHEEPIIVHGDGTSFWSACHRDDVARAFVGALGNERAFGKGYHTASEEWLTWDRYVQIVALAMGAPVPQIVHIPTDLLGRAAPRAAEWCVVNFHYNAMFDNRAASEDLGFRYTIPFLEGARRVVTWLEQRGRIEESAAHPWYDRILEAWSRLGEGMVTELAGLDL